MIDLRLPNINAKSREEQLEQLKSYLYQLVGQLNFALNTENTSSVSNETDISGYITLKDLVTKAQNEIDRIEKWIKNGTIICDEVNDVIQASIDFDEGVTYFATSESTDNLPDDDGFDDSIGYVFKKSDTNISIHISNYLDGSVAIKTLNGATWSDWKYIIAE